MSLIAQGLAGAAAPLIGSYIGAQAQANGGLSNWFSSIFGGGSSASSNTDSELSNSTNKFEEYLSDVTRTNAEQLDRNMQYNAYQAELNRKFNAEQAQLNRDFQERMSNTSYQRAVQDLMNAGLNPILAFSHGSASTPSGSSASSNAASMSTGGGVQLQDFIYLLSVLTSAANGFMSNKNGGTGNLLRLAAPLIAAGL